MKIFAKTAKHDTNVAYILVGWQLCLPLCDNEVIKCIYLNSIYNGRQ